MKCEVECEVWSVKSECVWREWSVELWSVESVV